MKFFGKKLLSMFLAAAIVLSGVSGSILQVNAAAPYLKKIKVPMGMKKLIPYNFTVKYAGGVGKKPFTWTIMETNKKQLKNNRSKVELGVMYGFDEDFSPKEVDAILKSDYFKKYDETGPGEFFAVVDGKTGKMINDKNVKITKKELDMITKQRNGTVGYLDEAVFYSLRITITYPNNYKDLYFGLCGNNNLNQEGGKLEEGFFDGKIPFGKTSYYKEGKINSRWIDISKL